MRFTHAMSRTSLASVRRLRGTLPDRVLAKRLGLTRKEFVAACMMLDQEHVNQIPPTIANAPRALFRNTLTRVLSMSPLSLALVLFSFAALLRIIFLLVLRNDPILTIPILDADAYLSLAKDIASGHLPPGAFFTEPGYAYVLAAFVTLFGDIIIPVALFQSLLGSLVPVLTFFAALRFRVSKGCALLAGLAGAFYGEGVFYDSVLLKTSLEIFLLSLFLFMFALFRERLSPGRAFLLGFVAGVTALVKANILYAVPLFAAGVWFATGEDARRSLVASFAALFLGLALPLFPAAIHNYRADGTFALVSTSGGANLFVGHWEGSDGSLRPPEFISVDPKTEGESWKKAAEAYTGHPLTAGEVSSYWSKRAAKEILDRPGDFVSSLFRKSWLLINSRSLGDNYDFATVRERFPPLSAAVPYALIMGFGLAGIGAGLVRKETRSSILPLVFLFAGYVLTLVGSHVTDRYRAALVPLLLLFMAFFFATTKAWRQEQRAGLIITTLLFVFAITSFSLLPTSGIAKTTLADMAANFGIAAKQSGDIDRARIFFEEGLSRNYRHVPSVTALARLELEDGNTSRAIALYRQALVIQPELQARELFLALETEASALPIDDVRNRLVSLDETAQAERIMDADLMDGLAAIRKRDFTTASKHLEQALTRNPGSAQILSNLATAYKNTGRGREAETLFTQALLLDPTLLSARFNYANLLSESKVGLPAAIREYEEIERIVPNFAFVRYYIGLSYAQRGDFLRGGEYIQKFIDDSDPADPLRKSALAKAKQDLENMRAAGHGSSPLPSKNQR